MTEQQNDDIMTEEWQREN